MSTTKTPKTATKDNKAQDAASDVFTLAEAARDLGKNPKAVRGRFRKLYDAEDTSSLPKTVKGAKSRWVYRIEDREAVNALIGDVKE